MSYNARVDYVASGSSAEFAIPFPYISEGNIVVYASGVLFSGTFTFPDSSHVLLSLTPAAGVVVSVRRQTVDATVLAMIQAGSIDPADLNLDSTQLLYLIQEGQDGVTNIANRAPLVPDDDIATSSFGEPAARDNLNIGFDASGNYTTGLSTLAQIDAAVGAFLSGPALNGTLGIIQTTAALLALFPSALSLPNGTVFRTGGRTVVGDGGGSDFQYVASDITTTDNGGTIRVDAYGRRWYAIINGDVSTSLWPTDPSGVNDSTTALQAALDWAATAMNSPGTNPWNGKTYAKPFLIVEPGRYKLSNSLIKRTGVNWRGRYHPAMTENSTRLIMNSTGVTPARRWTASTVIQVSMGTQPTIANGYWYKAQSVSGNQKTGSSQPTWPTTIGNTVNDGNVVWVCFAVTQSGDNRNLPILKFSRMSISGTPTLLNQFVTGSTMWLEFWGLTIGSTFDSPLSGNGIPSGDYPGGAAIAFLCDTGDYRYRECCFQNMPANVLTYAPHGTADDGANNANYAAFWEYDCEHDSSALHHYAHDCQVGINVVDCELYGTFSNIVNCTGDIVLKDNFHISGNGSNAGSWYVTGPALLNSFTASGGRVERSNSPPTFNLQNVKYVAITDYDFTGASNQSDIILTQVQTGRVQGIGFDCSGFNATQPVSAATMVAALWMDGCGTAAGGIKVDNLNLTDTLGGGAYNGFGVATTSVAATSQNNMVSNVKVAAAYNTSPYAGAPEPDCYINLQPGDIHGSGNYKAGGLFSKTPLAADGGIAVGGLPIINGTTFGGTVATNMTAQSLPNGVYDVYVETYVSGTPNSLNFGTYKLIIRAGGGSILQKILETNNNASGAISSSGTTITTTVSGANYVTYLAVNRMAAGSFG